jgi:hypothetical protein
MRRFQFAVIALLLVVSVAAGVVRFQSSRSHGPDKFCSANGLLAPDGSLYVKNADCQWIDRDGNVVVDVDGNPVTNDTPPDKLVGYG